MKLPAYYFRILTLTHQLIAPEKYRENGDDLTISPVTRKMSGTWQLWGPRQDSMPLASSELEHAEWSESSGSTLRASLSLSDAIPKAPWRDDSGAL